ncbi:CapA family protein [Polymorphobacter sp.]|uniref:CapA family protein n=1 Tax=Polymorphobacter sp. TaxID=1909290 RepID=UPI003F725851
MTLVPPTTLTRRTLLGAGGTMLLAGCASRPAANGPATGPATLRINLIGQALMRENICAQDWPAKDEISARLLSADLTISDLEVVIRGPRSGTPTRGAETLHTASPDVIDCLRSLGVGMVNSASNHAFDLNTGGILDTMQALGDRGMPFAGTGMTLADASRAKPIDTPGGPVALVAAAAGFIREGGAATPTRPGVAELRRGPDGLDPEDVTRMLAAIAATANPGTLVIAYLHDHLWEADNAVTPAWKRRFARQCIEAGAGAFFSHGAPLLQGIEMHRGRPIFHDLGSFTFQTKKVDDAYDHLAWQSLIAECRFEAGAFVSARLVPVQLDAQGAAGPNDLATRGRPRLAHGAEATAILDRITALSARLGQTLVRDGEAALLEPSRQAVST